jgi:hypothetical protein
MTIEVRYYVPREIGNGYVPRATGDGFGCWWGLRGVGTGPMLHFQDVNQYFNYGYGVDRPDGAGGGANFGGYLNTSGRGGGRGWWSR